MIHDEPGGISDISLLIILLYDDKVQVYFGRFVLKVLFQCGMIYDLGSKISCFLLVNVLSY